MEPKIFGKKSNAYFDWVGLWRAKRGSKAEERDTTSRCSCTSLRNFSISSLWVANFPLNRCPTPKSTITIAPNSINTTAIFITVITILNNYPFMPTILRFPETLNLRLHWKCNSTYIYITIKNTFLSSYFHLFIFFYYVRLHSSIIDSIPQISC